MDPMTWLCKRSNGWLRFPLPIGCLTAVLAGGLTGCARSEKVRAESDVPKGISVGVSKVGRKTLERQLTVSSELVPFQEVDVYAKESGYVHDLLVDYGTRVKKGQVMAVLEIPELEVQLQQDDAAIRNASDQVTHAEHELGRVEAQHKVLHLQFDRLNSVAKSKPGLVAQQEVDDSQGKDLAAEAQVEATKSNLQAAQSQLQAAQAKKEHDQRFIRLLQNHSAVRRRDYAALRQSGHAAAGGHEFQHSGNAAGAAFSGRPVPPGDSGTGILCAIHPHRRSRQGTGELAQPQLPGQGDAFLRRRERRHAHDAHRSGRVQSGRMCCCPAFMPKRPSRLERKADAIAMPLQAVSHEGEETTVYVVDSGNKIEDRSQSCSEYRPRRRRRSRLRFERRRLGRRQRPQQFKGRRGRASPGS